MSAKKYEENRRGIRITGCDEKKPHQKKNAKENIKRSLNEQNLL